MNLADIIVVGILILILALIFYVTRVKKKDHGGCGGCSSECSSCHAFSNFYEDYKKDETEK